MISFFTNFVQQHMFWKQLNANRLTEVENEVRDVISKLSEDDQKKLQDIMEWFANERYTWEDYHKSEGQ